jgi:hypothetical protein
MTSEIKFGHYQCPYAIEQQPYKNWLTHTVETIKPKDGLRAFVDVISSVHTLATEVFESAPVFAHFGLVEKYTNSLFGSIDLLSHLQWWVCSDEKTLEEKQIKVLYTSTKCVRWMVYISEKIQLDISVVNTLVCNIPAVRIALDSMTITALILGILKSKREFDEASLRAKEHVAALVKLKNSQNRDADAIRKWEKITKHDAIALNKMSHSLAYDFGCVALLALGIVVDATGLSALRSVKIIVAGLGTVSSCQWLYNSYKDEKYQGIDVLSVI